MKETAKSADNLDDIPSKRYFTIGEVSELCGLKAHVLRYWEQEFPQLSPVKRRGNRRYYQRDDVLLIRDIRHLLYEEGFTIQGARQKLEQRTRETKKIKGREPGAAISTQDVFPGIRTAGQVDQQSTSDSEPPAQARQTGPAPHVLTRWRKLLEEAEELLK